ncbi:MAG: hypothetical protein ABIB71_02910 [Candidatus Woesearchaeota archaeon]
MKKIGIIIVIGLLLCSTFVAAGVWDDITGAFKFPFFSWKAKAQTIEETENLVEGTPIEEAVELKKGIGEPCTVDSQCQSGYCKAISRMGKKCAEREYEELTSPEASAEGTIIQPKVTYQGVLDMLNSCVSESISQDGLETGNEKCTSLGQTCVATIGVREGLFTAMFWSCDKAVVDNLMTLDALCCSPP